jgi:hypothetical protein
MNSSSENTYWKKNDDVAFQNWNPIRYPNSPPMTDPTEHMKAYQNARLGMPRARAINRTSGGMGNREDSINARRNRAGVP